jgi:hypothetical protein
LPSSLEIITSALKINGVLGQAETPTSSEADDGLLALNDFLDSLSIDRTNIYTIAQVNFPLTNGVATYTIGSGGTFNTTRPVKIDNTFIRINSVDYPLKEINNQDYDSISYKGNGSFPYCFYYDAGFPLGTIYIYGVPTQGSIYLDTWTPLAQFANLTTQYTFPLGYYRMLRYNLAKELAPLYRVSMTQEAQIIATESLANIKDRNLPAPVMKTEVGLLVGTMQHYRTGP